MSNNQIFIASGRAITTVSDSDNSIFGSNATTDEVVKITDAAATNIIVDANVERVQFTGAIADYKYLVVGTNLKIYNAAGTLVSTIGVQADETTVQLAAGAKLGTQLTFANGTVDAKITGLNAVTLGDQAVSATTAAAVVIPTAKIDATLASAPIPVFSVAGAASATEGGNALFTVTLANPSATTATTVKYALSNLGSTTSADYGTAVTAGTNVTDAAGTLTFAAGATTATVTVPVTFDSAIETGEGVTLTLSAPSAGTVSSTGAAVTTAFADAPAPTFTMTSSAVAGVSVQEGNTITFTVTPSGIVNAATVLNLNVVGAALGAISATTSATDFTTASAITFAAGETAAKTITVTVVNDGTTEGIEAYKAQLLDSSFNEKAAIQGTVADALPTLTLSQANATVNEGGANTYTITSSAAAPAGGLTVPYTVAGTATSGSDYTAVTGTATILAGATTGTFTVTTIADKVTETAETLIVSLGTTTGANLSTVAGATTATTTILDTSTTPVAGAVTLSSSAATITETAGSNVVTYTVELGSAAPAGGVNIPYTLSGTATNLTDYTGSAATTGNFTILAGATAGTLVLTTVADSTTEGAEAITVTLGTLPVGYTLATGTTNTTTTSITDSSAAVAGSNFSLTTAIDNITGTAGNDTIQALEASFGALDVIDAGAGVDNFVLASTSAALTLSSSQITNVETLTFLAATNGLTASLAGITGVTTVVNNGSSVGLIVGSGANSLAAVGAVNITNTAQATTVVYKETAVAGTTDAVALTLSGATGAVNLNTETANTVGLETVNLVSTGVTNSITLATNDTVGLATVNISGSTDVTVALSTNVTTTATTINASTATGKVTVTGIGAGVTGVGATAVGHTITGGTGNDSFTLDATYKGGAATVLDRDVINGGAGTDTLNVTLAMGTVTTAQANLTSIEALTISDAWTTGVSLNTTYFADVTAVTLAAATAGTSTMTLNSGTSVTLAGDTDTTVATTFAVGGVATTDTMTLNMAGFDWKTGATANFATTGIETLNITTGATVTSVATMSGTTTMTASAGGTPVINVSGANGMTFTGNVTASAINASTLTGALLVSGTAQNAINITGGTAADNINGSAAADLLTGGLGADTITGLAGNDSIVLTEATAAVDRVVFSASGSNGSDVITGFATTSDKLDFNTAIAGTTGTFVTVTSASPGAVVATANLKDFVDIITTSGSTLKTAGSTTLATADLTAATLTNVAAYIAEYWTGSSSITDTDTGIFVINSTITGATSGNSYVYQWDNDTTANVTQAGELLLIGTIVAGTVVSGDLIALA